MAKEVIMPALGMAQETGTLLTWHKAEGEQVEKGDLLMTVATDKTDVDIEAPAAGTLRGIQLQEGEEAPVGDVIAWLLAEGETVPAAAVATKAEPSAPTSAARTPTSPAPAAAKQSTLLSPLAATPLAARIAAEHNLDLTQVPASGDRIQKEDVLAYLAQQDAADATQSSNGRVLASPKARRLAGEAGLDLAAIDGSGPEGAVLAADVEAAAAVAAQSPAAPAIEPATGSPSTTVPVTTVPMSRPWRIMAQRLQESWQSVPHFYLERDLNASALVAWRAQLQARQSVKITYTDLLVKVVASALQRHPRLNAAWQEGEIVANTASNVGLAVAVEEGLLVPVIHGAETLGLATIAERRAAVVERALAGALQPADMAGGTFTISNLGMFGVDRFNAIVNPPQAAILAVGALAERVVPVDGHPAVQPMMTLTLSCDHRIVDGARAAQFLQSVVGCLEDPLQLLD